MIELYLVRHAIAEERGPDWPDDTKRPLTGKGTRRFEEVTEGLRTVGVRFDAVFSSPLVRARQTADVLARRTTQRRAVKELDALAPGGAHDALFQALAKADAGTRLALVGHEPDLGVLAGTLLGLPGVIAFRKGAVCRIDVDRLPPGGPGQLVWLAPPRLLRRAAR